MKIPCRLETDRLVIRRYTEDDLEGLHRFFNNRDITSMTDMPAEMSLEETEAFLRMLINSYDTQEPIAALAICKKENKEVVGSCGFAAVDFSDETQIYYALKPEFRSYGYATEAMEKLIEYMIIVLDIEKISIYCNPENSASISLAKRIGMQSYGTIQHENRDAEYFLLTREKYLMGNNL